MDRLQRILELRSHGMTYEAIGKTLGVSKERVRQLVSRAINRDRIAPPVARIDAERERKLARGLSLWPIR
jgi:DNA-directed RNA polymerase sigma subunit (sigma70/sigma32)